MRHRQEEIRAKGFALTEPEPTGAPLDFSKLRVGVKTLEDAIDGVKEIMEDKIYGS